MNKSVEEVWKNVTVSGFEDRYQVSSFGRVRSLDKNIPNRWGGFRFIPGKEMSLVSDRSGYKKVGFRSPGVYIRFSVHRLVGFCFIENKLNKPSINHKNGIKFDNRVSNLEWVTAQENTIHSFKVLKRIAPNKGRFGVLNKTSIAINQISKDNVFIKRWDSIADASRFYSVASTSIVAVCKKNKYRYYCAGFKWEYCV